MIDIVIVSLEVLMMLIKEDYRLPRCIGIDPWFNPDPDFLSEDQVTDVIEFVNQVLVLLANTNSFVNGVDQKLNIVPIKYKEIEDVINSIYRFNPEFQEGEPYILVCNNGYYLVIDKQYEELSNKHIGILSESFIVFLK